jgi:hypothetical protein
MMQHRWNVARGRSRDRFFTVPMFPAAAILNCGSTATGTTVMHVLFQYEHYA